MTSHDLRCPACNAHVRPDADWCTLCYTDLRVPPEAPEAPEAPVAAEAETAPGVEAPDGESPVDPATVPEQAGGQATGRHGKHARAATSYVNAMLDGKATPHDQAEEAAIEARADEMLAMLAADNANALGPLAERLRTTQSRVVAGLIGVVAVSLVGWLVMTVLGQFL